MQVEVGKKYRCRNGIVATATSIEEEHKIAKLSVSMGDRGHQQNITCYTNGVNIYRKEFDLMEEIKEDKFMCYVDGMGGPRKVHNDLTSAQTEAQRLAAQKENVGKKVYCLKIISTYQAQVSVKEI